MFENATGKIENGTVFIGKKTILLEDVFETKILHIRFLTYGITLLVISTFFLLPLISYLLGISRSRMHHSPVSFSFTNILNYSLIIFLITLGIRAIKGTFYYSIFGHEHERFKTKFRNESALREFDIYLKQELVKTSS